MKKVGIVGGMGPESTIPYYHEIVYGVQKRLGVNCFPNLTIESVDVFTVLRLCKEKRYDDLVDYLLEVINNLCKCKADFIVLSANTPHIVYDRLVDKVEVPIISIIEETAKMAKKCKYKKLGLLGTEFTMKETFFKAPFINKGIEIVTPPEEQMKYIAEKISSELELGIVNQETQDKFYQIISMLKQNENIDAVILGCTELPIIIQDDNSPVKCLDTMKIHIESIIDLILLD